MTYRTLTLLIIILLANYAKIVLKFDFKQMHVRIFQTV